MKEEWKPIPRYEGHYAVSDQGRIWSVRKGGALRPQKEKGGYLKVNLCKEGKIEQKRVHRLVLQVFIGDCPDGMECLHLDGNPANNRVENLRWGTHAQNNRDIVRHGRNVNKNKTHCPRGHALIPKNLTEYSKRDGYRICLACNRTRGRIQKHPELCDFFQQISDQYYARIMKEGA